MKKRFLDIIYWGGIFIIIVVCTLFGVVVTYHTIVVPAQEKAYFRSIPEVKQAEIDAEVLKIQAGGYLWVSGGFTLLVVLAGVPFLLALGKYRKNVKQASVHTYRIGKYNEVVIHENDLNIAAPIAMGLMNAQQLKEMNAGVEQAFKISERIVAMGEKAVRHHCLSSQNRLVEIPETVSENMRRVPTFQKLLHTGELAPGRPMILGYENGLPRRGSFLDIYSAAVAGESGSGKTATLLFLIGSGLVAQRIRFVAIDPHYPHPKSLGFKTKPLWEAGLMSMATYKDDMLAVLNAVERTIDKRLQQIDTDTTPLVLVIDELAFLVKTSIGPAVTHTMERISMEGRKCAVYMLASSQTWLSSRTGKSSVVRDTLTSAYVHRIKPKQANLLLQDKEEAEKVKKHVKHAGDALLVPVGDESLIVKMPFTTDADMRLVVEMVEAIGPRTNVSQRSAQETREVFSLPSDTLPQDTDIDREFQKLLADAAPAALPEHETEMTAVEMTAADSTLDLTTEYALRKRTQELLQAGKTSYGKILDGAGIAKSTARGWVTYPQKTLKPEQKTALRDYLNRLEQELQSSGETHVHPVHKHPVHKYTVNA